MRTLTILLLAGVLLSGCNTFRGLGEDIRLLGEAIGRASSKK